MRVCVCVCEGEGGRGRERDREKEREREKRGGGGVVVVVEDAAERRGCVQTHFNDGCNGSVRSSFFICTVKSTTVIGNYFDVCALVQPT